ncbi:BlaR1 family beta-lactam sensor/signal transducer [Lentibacillus sp. L22]|uniref:BlaR1 family beta-lactam sensor/signal transducer n=2 Tax=Lentibacillus TaxID=175304 RepID=UPI0034679A3F
MMDTLILRFLLSTLVVSLLILAILITKKVLYKHMSVRTHYKIWYFLLLSLVTSFFPWNIFRLGEVPQYLKSLLSTGKYSTFRGESISRLDHSAASNTDLLHDFTVSVNKSTPDVIYHTFITVWVIGIAMFIGLAICSLYQIHQIKKSATTIPNRKINEMLAACKEVVGVKRKIRLTETDNVTSPITLGILQPHIILPKKTRETFSLAELKYVFLHELYHQKSKDVFVNYVMLLVQAIYWFNPFVWLALKRMQKDRELACDAGVLNLLDEREYIEYGHTIIHFADKSAERSYGRLAPGIGGTKQQIKQRVQNIANFHRDSPLLKWKGKIICAVLGVFVLLLTPFTAVIASTDDVFDFNGKNTVYEDLSSYFDGYNGSFVLYDASKKQYQIYNSKMSRQRVSPDSTYKIYSALFGLESNVISANNSEQMWDGQIHPYQEWNKNQNLSTALGNSVNWYFQHIDQEVGRKQLNNYFHKIKYGNEDLSGNLDRYWMESSLKISPIEQVQLLYALEENKFGFKEKNIQAIRKALLIGEQNDRQLYGKTGTGTVDGKDVNGWFVGFVTKAGHTYYFAVNIQDENGRASGDKAAEIADMILRDKNIY